MKKIKIVYILLSNLVAGTERHALDLAVGVEKARYEVSVISYGGEIGKECNRNNIRHYCVNRRNVLVVMEICNILRKVSPQIVHAHLGKSGLYGRIAAYLMRCPIIIYTDHAWASKNTDISHLNNYIHIVVYKILSVFTNKIICVSEAVYMYLKNEVGINPSKLICILNGIKIDYCKKVRNKNDTKIHFGIIARLEDEKNHICLFEALQKLKKENFDLYVVGDGKNMDYYKSYCINHQIDNKTIFTGRLYGNDLVRIYEKIDVLVLPSKRETFGLVLLEAMENYIPCIGSNVGGIPEVIDNGVNGFLFNSGNVEELAEKMMYFVKNMNQIDLMGQKARRIVENKFSIQKTINKIQDLYEHELRIVECQ